MGQKHKKVSVKNKRKVRFRRKESAFFVMSMVLRHRWHKLKELVVSLEEDAIKKKILDLLSSLEED